MPPFRTRILPTASLSEKTGVTLVVFLFFAFKFLKYLITYTQYLVGMLSIPLFPGLEYRFDGIPADIIFRGYWQQKVIKIV
jgi:hypothetical protein